MLLSQKHKCIFIHVAKVAGQSVTNALMPYAASPWQRKLAMVCPYRYQLKVYSKMRKRFGVGYFSSQPDTDHVRASTVLAGLGEAAYREYFSFAFVQNPWDRAVSIYTYAKKNVRHYLHKKVLELGSFENYIKWHCGGGEVIHPQSEYVYDQSGNIIVDYIGKQETLNHDFSKVCNNLNISPQLRHFNVSHADSYHRYYNDETRDLVAVAYREDVYLFGYEF